MPDTYALPPQAKAVLDALRKKYGVTTIGAVFRKAYAGGDDMPLTEEERGCIARHLCQFRCAFVLPVYVQRACEGLL